MLASEHPRIGVISDTHGRLDPSILRAFAGVVHIIHAGDIGKRSVLRKLEKLAPLTAVSGNTDIGRLAKELPTQTMGEAASVAFLVAHKPKQLKRVLRRGVPAGVRLVVTGHLHETHVSWEDGVLYLNPGTASSPEEGDPGPTVAVVTVAGDLLTVTFVPVGKTAALEPAAAAAGAPDAAAQAPDATPEAVKADTPAGAPPDVDSGLAKSPPPEIMQTAE
jgi:uncharacterized protein